MKLGGHYRVREVGVRELRKIGEERGFAPTPFSHACRKLCAAPAAITEGVHDECRQNGLYQQFSGASRNVLKSARYCVCGPDVTPALKIERHPRHRGRCGQSSSQQRAKG